MHEQPWTLTRDGNVTDKGTVEVDLDDPSVDVPAVIDGGWALSPHEGDILHLHLPDAQYAQWVYERARWQATRLIWRWALHTVRGAGKAGGTVALDLDAVDDAPRHIAATFQGVALPDIAARGEVLRLHGHGGVVEWGWTGTVWSSAAAEAAERERQEDQEFWDEIMGR